MDQLVFILLALPLVALSFILVTPFMPRVKRIKTKVFGIFLFQIDFFDH